MSDMDFAELDAVPDAIAVKTALDPLQFSDNEAMARVLADYFVPPRADILDLGCGDARLRDVVKCTSYVGLDIEPRQADIQYFDLNARPLPERLLQGSNFVVMMQIVEYLDDPGALLAQIAASGRPLLCTHWTKAFVRNSYESPSAWRREYTTDDFEALIKSAGFEVAYRFLFAGGQLLTYLLFPTDARAPRNAWWTGADGRRFLKQCRKRGDRQLAGYAARRDAEGWHPSRKWEQRSIFAATLIPKGLAIMDVGCGGMYFEKHAEPGLYRPVDVEARDERTRIHDLDAALLPSAWLEEVDLVSFLGVLEYVVDPAAHLRHIAAHGRAVLCTYNVAERRSTRNYTKWTSALDTDAFEAALTDGGFTIARKFAFGNRQMVWLALPENVAEPPAWWSALPDPAPAEVAQAVPDEDD